MATLDMSESTVTSIIQWGFNILLALAAFIWRHTFGKLEERVDNIDKRITETIEKRILTFEESCGECRRSNEQHFASQDDLKIIRADHKQMMDHIDRRFDNLTAIIVAARNAASL